MYTQSIALSIVALALIWFRHRILQRQLIGVASVFIVINMVSVWCGFLFYSPNAQGASIRLEIPLPSLIDILVGVNVLMLAFAIGAIAGAILRPSWLIPSQQAGLSSLQGLVNRISPNVLLISSLVILCVFIYGNGVSGLIFRNEYMTEESQVAKSVGAVGTLCAVLVQGIKLGSNMPIGFQRLGLYTVSTGTILTYGAYSSRMFAIGFVILGVGLYMGSIKRARIIYPLAGLAAFPFLLHLSLLIRGEYEQGLAPLLAATFAAQTWMSIDFATLLNNTITSNFAITSLSAIHGDIGISYLFTSINPLPGFLTDWYTLNTGLNSSTPYSAVGEWLAYGLTGGVPFFLLLGFIYDDLDLRIKKGNILAALLGSAFFLLAAITMLQYNTRSAVRFIYYFYFLNLFFSVVNYLLRGGVSAPVEQTVDSQSLRRS